MTRAPRCNERDDQQRRRRGVDRKAYDRGRTVFGSENGHGTSLGTHTDPQHKPTSEQS
jgi:hypothetical protein